MTDSQLRELERRFRASGSAEDEAAWLRARVQAGELERSSLELAAYLGSEAAREFLGPSAPRHTLAPKTGVLGFVRKGLAFWGPLPCLRAAIAATRMVISDSDDLPEEVGRIRVHLAEEYAVDPRDDILQRLRAQPRTPLPQNERWQTQWWICTRCAWALSAQEDPGNLFTWKAKDAVEEVTKAVGSESPVRAAITAELIPWALGYRDPVRERVEARQRGAAAE
ncbi:MAG: hypothetical protein KC766_24210 [Myxococcales bacterium]|nr:hypothetical protein [Myxococcales bacterium]